MLNCKGHGGAVSASTCVQCEDWERLGVPAKAVCIVWQDNCIAKSYVG